MNFWRLCRRMLTTLGLVTDNRQIVDHPTYESRGGRWWSRNGESHREGGPAIELSDGSKYWYKDGKRHREDGPALIEPGGLEEWWLDGARHRTDGPAVLSCSYKVWYFKGACVGYGEEGFWGLWSKLSAEQRADPALLRWMPKVCHADHRG